MASTYTYEQTITNKYLNKTKIVKAKTAYELDLKVKDQLAIWAKQEAAQREKDAKIQLENAMKGEVASSNQDIATKLEEYHNILSNALKRKYTIDWDGKKKIFEYPDFSYREFMYDVNPPIERSLEWFFAFLRVPQKNFLEKIFKGRVQRRIEKEKEASKEYNKWRESYNIELEKYNEQKHKAEIEYEKEKAEALEKYNSQREQAEKETDTYNEEVDKLHNDYNCGEPNAVSQIIGDALSASAYPDNFVRDCRVEYTNNDKIAIVTVILPNASSILSVKEYKYVASTRSIKQIDFKQKEFDGLYNSIIKQIALRTLYETFSYDNGTNIQTVVFNGWIDGTNKATGQDFKACILSVQMSREEFESINFSQVDAAACIKNLKGICAGNLAELVPVKPIMELDTEDSRFVASKDILERLDSGDNLATMDWEDFEHLVRELFSKYFSDEGQNVQVTQSSRDGGVDAVAFDPDPIKGGKFVIQAKRYNRVVPVSAVRDLYGTMINEGAAKGILVTTSYFGSDSRNFVKDKPITLIDGNNLIHMCSQYGYDVHIKLQS